MTNDTWGEWIPHKAGDPCPIPGVNVGDYQVEFEHAYLRLIPSIGSDLLIWDNVTRYRLRKPAVDWEALAREAVKMLSSINCPLNASFNAGSEEREGGSTRRQGKELDVVTAFRRDVHAFLDRARKAGIE